MQLKCFIVIIFVIFICPALTTIWRATSDWTVTHTQLLLRCGTLPYMKVVGNFCMVDPPFWHFSRSCRVLILCPFQSYWYPTRSFFRKINVSITFSSRDNAVPFFPKSVIWLLWSIFFINYLIDCQCNWPPYSLNLDLFYPSFLHNIRSNWVKFLFACWTPYLILEPYLIYYSHATRVLRYFV